MTVPPPVCRAPSEPAAGHSVALLNAGMPGTVAKLGEGRVYLNPDARPAAPGPAACGSTGRGATAPDGVQPLLAALDPHLPLLPRPPVRGDWRRRRVRHAPGRSSTTPCSPRQTTAHPGEPPARTGLVVGRAGHGSCWPRSNPAGNPLASARAARPDPTCRTGSGRACTSRAGRPAEARITLFHFGLRRRPRLSDPLEDCAPAGQRGRSTAQPIALHARTRPRSPRCGCGPPARPPAGRPPRALPRRAGPARLHPLLAAQQGTGAAGQPARPRGSTCPRAYFLGTERRPPVRVTVASSPPAAPEASNSTCRRASTSPPPVRTPTTSGPASTGTSTCASPRPAPGPGGITLPRRSATVGARSWRTPSRSASATGPCPPTLTRCSSPPR